MIQQYHTLGYIQRNVNQDTIKILAHPRLVQHYSKPSNYGNNPDALQLMSGLRKCSIYIQWNILPPKRRMKFYHFQVNELNWKHHVK
jgi:hypothetical protein